MWFTGTQWNKKRRSKTPLLEQVEGIEPSLSGRKHDILPLNYTCKWFHIYYTIIYLLLQDKYIKYTKEKPNFLNLASLPFSINKYVVIHISTFKNNCNIVALLEFRLIWDVSVINNNFPIGVNCLRMLIF